MLIVSELEIAGSYEEAPENARSFTNVAVLVEHAHGETCDRCRIISEEVGTFEEAPTLCARCYHIVKEHYPEALLADEEE